MDKEIQDLFLSQTPFIDVRSPIEFKEGSIPGSVNLPILDDLERALVGTCYKIHGQDQAIKLGYELLAGDKKERRVNAWISQIKIKPNSKVICFRGGLRSQLTCEWLKERGIHCERIPGGYKRLRNFSIDFLASKNYQLIRLAGLTGSGKTELLRELTGAIDLEDMANHRGSAFGDVGEQTSQTSFENKLAYQLLLRNNLPIVVEDEGRTIGKICLPNVFYEDFRKSPMMVLTVDRETRISNIFNDYVSIKDCNFFLANLDRLKTKLSSKIYQEIKTLIKFQYENQGGVSGHGEWISLLLEHYYDPLYLKALKRDESLIVFTGNKSEIIDHWNNKSNPRL